MGGAFHFVAIGAKSRLKENEVHARDVDDFRYYLSFALDPPDSREHRYPIIYSKVR